MASLASTRNIGAANYSYHNQIHLSLPEQLPPPSESTDPCPLTPPASTASSGCVRDYGHDDGSLSDIQEDEGEGGNSDIKDVILLEEISSNTSSSAAVSVQLVNVCPNKITLWEGNSHDVSTRNTNTSAQTYLKDRMKDVFLNMDEGCTSELMVLIGADGGVVIHKSLIATYSKLVRDQLSEYPDCTSVYLPNYSQKIIRKMVQILYTGETFYSENEKKDVNLIWDAMRQLQILFDDKSFYYHPVEYTAVKEEEEGQANSQQTVQSASPIDQAEVDQTSELWHEDQSSVQKAKSTFTHFRVIRQPHPENPSKSVYVHSKYGEGKKIQRAMQALDHVKSDEDREKERIENKKQAEKLLSKHKPIVIDLLDDEDCPTPIKKSRTQIYPASTNVVRDEEFRQLITSGMVTLDMIRNATANRRQNPVTIPDQLLVTAIPQSDSEIPQHPRPILPEQTSVSIQRIDAIVPSVIIPPNRPEGTGITFIQKSPGTDDVSPNLANKSSPAKSVSEMPTLQPETLTDQAGKKRLLRRRSFDITDIPTLDRLIYVDSLGVQTLREIEGVAELGESNNSVPGVSVPAVVIPVSQVNRFLQNPPVPCTSSSVVSQCEDDRMKTRVRKRKLNAPMYECGDRNAELMLLKEAFRQEQAIKSTVVVVGSKKKPVPEDVKVDTYVENLEQDDNEIDMNTMFGDIPPSFNVVVPPAAFSLETKNARGGRGKRGTRGRGTGKGRGRPTTKFSCSNEDGVKGQGGSQTSVPVVPDQPKTSRRGRGGRRGSRK